MYKATVNTDLNYITFLNSVYLYYHIKKVLFFTVTYKMVTSTTTFFYRELAGQTSCYT